jgi:tryptophan-rich sensory protein
MNILLSFISTLLLSFIELIYLLGVLIAIGFILGFFEKHSNKFLVRAFGPQGVLITAWIGTPIHEIGHLIQCFLWGHRVSRVKLLQLKSPDGVLGFVEHQYNPNSIYQQVGNFFIGLGPIFSGIGSLIVGMYLFVPQSYSTFRAEIHLHVSLQKLDINVLKTIGVAVIAISKSLFTLHNFINPLFWIFLVLAISISSHIALSKADIQSSARGLMMIFCLLVLFNIVAGFLHMDSYRMIVKLGEYNAYVLAFSSIALLFSLLTLVFSYLLYKLKTF